MLQRMSDATTDHPIDRRRHQMANCYIAQPTAAD
jgi:hypothetical protein